MNPVKRKTIAMEVKAADLAYYDESSSSWVVDAGIYQFLKGASSCNIRASLDAEVAASSVKTNDILKLREPLTVLHSK